MAQLSRLMLTPNQKRAVAVSDRAAGLWCPVLRCQRMLTDGTTLQVFVVLGGVQSANQIRKWVKAAQDKQTELVREAYGKQTTYQQKQAAKVAVNKVFLNRLSTILSM